MTSLIKDNDLSFFNNIVPTLVYHVFPTPLSNFVPIPLNNIVNVNDFSPTLTDDVVPTCK